MARIKRLRNKSEKEIMRAALRKGQVVGGDWIKLFREYQLREQPDAKERLSLWELAVENKWLKDAALIQAIHEIRKLKNPPKAEKIPSAEEQNEYWAKQREAALKKNAEYIETCKKQDAKIQEEQRTKPQQPKTRDPHAPRKYYLMDDLRVDVTDLIDSGELVEVRPQIREDGGWTYEPVKKI